MTLSTFSHPLASYSTGETVTKGGQSSGQASGFLCRAENGQVCVVSRTAVMAAPAFYYYPTLLAGWMAYRTGRDRQNGSIVTESLRAARIVGLRAELARLEQAGP